MITDLYRVEELPRLTYSFLEYFLKLDVKDKCLLEIGAGQSTLFWEKFFKSIVSYEDDKEYFETLRQQINQNKTTLKFFQNKNDLHNLNFINDIQKADYILIDNNPSKIDRLFFCEVVSFYKRQDTVIILDNGAWNMPAYTFLFNRYFVKDFPGINKVNHLSLTSIFEVIKSEEFYICKDYSYSEKL